ncbi:ATP synthase F0 subunit A [candidate division LCP-89 bacterium B3_LCP]|uniref:ATP synthase subunit a n=1 Tax=candidate division LCP-89 bacterium B3_LCP TaxID=2012998 RepID=A0A532UPS2_UNCL8|nr:MAG: ATP synthase F0 subunit A [candidate division LCP-89 bacterium B3_LCP]
MYLENTPMYDRFSMSRLVGLVLIILPLILFGGQLQADEHADHSGAASTGDSHQETVEAEHGTDAETHGEAASAEAGGHGEHGEEDTGVLGLLTHHLMDSNHYEFFGMDFHLPVLSIGGYHLPITKHTIMLITAAILLIVLVFPRRKVGSGVPHGWSNFIEVLIVFIRDEVVYPNLGSKYGRKYLSFFLTAFFFVLFSNLLGMIPYGSSSTGNIAVTGALASVSLIVMVGSGMIIHGPLKYMGSFIPHGIPAFVIPILFPIEIAGILVKHFALCIRLFANMLAGHAVITVFLGLISSYFIAPVAIVGAVAISLLELFVAFLQAYIFTMLSSLFIGAAVSGEH